MMDCRWAGITRAVLGYGLLCLTTMARGQQREQTVFTTDIDHFWAAYDSAQTTTDSLRQLHYIRTLYVEKGTEGLRAFMKARDYTPELWVQLIRRYPGFWRSVRPNTLTVKTKANAIDSSIQQLRVLYPSLRPAKMYFTIGGLRSGGTTTKNMVLIGAEIATADAGTDVTEFEDDWLRGVFRNQQLDNLIALNVHEYVHTQQKGKPSNVLAAALHEGACDFIAELVMGKPMPNNYIQYGRAQESGLKPTFRDFMFTRFFDHWMYNGGRADTVADLGYFMGYAICSTYYRKAPDKKAAVKEIIELDYSNNKTVEVFLKRSGYYTDPVGKEQLLQRFDERRPRVLRLEPFQNGDTHVDPSLQELRIIFSAPMNPKRISISHGTAGKEKSPLVDIRGYSHDDTVLTVTLDLKPGRDYEFLITERSFRSRQGYPLKPVKVSFRTKQ